MCLLVRRDMTKYNKVRHLYTYSLKTFSKITETSFLTILSLSLLLRKFPNIGIGYICSRQYIHCILLCVMYYLYKNIVSDIIHISSKITVGKQYLAENKCHIVLSDLLQIFLCKQYIDTWIVLYLCDKKNKPFLTFANPSFTSQRDSL